MANVDDQTSWHRHTFTQSLHKVLLLTSTISSYSILSIFKEASKIKIRSFQNQGAFFGGLLAYSNQAMKARRYQLLQLMLQKLFSADLYKNCDEWMRLHIHDITNEVQVFTHMVA